MVAGDDGDQYVCMNLGKTASTIMERRKAYWGDYTLNRCLLSMRWIDFWSTTLRNICGQLKRSVLVVLVCVTRCGVLEIMFLSLLPFGVSVFSLRFGG